MSEMNTGTYNLDVRMLHHQWMHCWNIWIAPLYKDRMWYSKNYFKETMQAFDNTEKAMTGMSMVFMMLPPSNVIIPDHK